MGDVHVFIVSSSTAHTKHTHVFLQDYIDCGRSLFLHHRSNNAVRRVYQKLINSIKHNVLFHMLLFDWVRVIVMFSVSMRWGDSRQIAQNMCVRLAQRMNDAPQHM